MFESLGSPSFYDVFFQIHILKVLLWEDVSASNKFKQCCFYAYYNRSPGDFYKSKKFDTG